MQEQNEQEYQTEERVSELDSFDNVHSHSETVRISEPAFVVEHKKKQLDKHVIWIWIPVLHINLHSGSSSRTLCLSFLPIYFPYVPFFKYLI